MADIKITELTALGTIETGDVFAIVDINDLGQAPSGSTKKVTIDTLEAYLNSNLSFISTETDPVFSASPAANVVDNLSNTVFLSGDGTYQSAGADGNGIYDGSGSLSGATTVTMGGNKLTLTGGDFNVDGSTFYVDYTNNRVGIGTAAPDSRLHIEGSTNLETRVRFKNTSSTAASNLLFENNNGLRYGLYLGGSLFSTGSGYDIQDQLSLFCQVTALPIMTWKNTSRYVGINIADKDNILAQLHVGGDTQIDGALTINTTTPSVIGQVWTATGTAGEGEWATAGGGAPPVGTGGIYGGSGSLSGARTVTLNDGVTDYNLTFASLTNSNLLNIDSANSNIGIGISPDNNSPLHVNLPLIADRLEISTDANSSGHHLLPQFHRIYDNSGVLNVELSSIGASVFKNSLRIGDTPTTDAQLNVGRTSGNLLKLRRGSVEVLQFYADASNCLWRFKDTAGVTEHELKHSGGYASLAGNFGIGTTTPSAKLHVAGDTYLQGNLKVLPTTGAPTVGDVWTATNVDGSGEWAAGGGDGNIAESDLTFTAVREHDMTNFGYNLNDSTVTRHSVSKDYYETFIATTGDIKAHISAGASNHHFYGRTNFGIAGGTTSSSINIKGTSSYNALAMYESEDNFDFLTVQVSGIAATNRGAFVRFNNHSAVDSEINAKNGFNSYLSLTGNLGIGTTSPSAKLHVGGDIRVDGTTSASSSGSSGTFLQINVGGTTYKLDLHTV